MNMKKKGKSPKAPMVNWPPSTGKKQKEDRREKLRVKIMGFRQKKKAKGRKGSGGGTGGTCWIPIRPDRDRKEEKGGQNEKKNTGRRWRYPKSCEIRRDKGERQQHERKKRGESGLFSESPGHTQKT